MTTINHVVISEGVCPCCKKLIQGHVPNDGLIKLKPHMTRSLGGAVPCPGIGAIVRPEAQHTTVQILDSFNRR